VWILDTNVWLLDAGLQDECSSVGDGKVALMKTELDFGVHNWYGIYGELLAQLTVTTN